MTILVTGGSGTIGSQVIAALQGHGVEVRALTRTPEKAKLPEGVLPVKGDLADLDSFRAALDGVSTLFLLVPNVADELTQAMLALNAAREADVKGIVYLSVFKGAEYVDVPHFFGKHTVERMIEALSLPVTVLRLAYFIQNDLRQKDALLGAGVYGMPIGHKGVAMVDTRDIGEAAARELLRREQALAPLPREAYDLVGPDNLTGEDLARLWSAALGRPVRYGGDDLVALEQRLKALQPAWQAADLRLMLRGYQEIGATASAQAVARLAQLLGRAPHSYREFAEGAAAGWSNG